MNRMPWMDDFQKNLADLIAKSPAADIERNVRAMMTQTFSKLDLVTREEFDVQSDLLARTRARLDELSARLDRLQATQSAGHVAGAGAASHVHATGTTGASAATGTAGAAAKTDTNGAI